MKYTIKTINRVLQTGTDHDPKQTNQMVMHSKLTELKL